MTSGGADLHPLDTAEKNKTKHEKTRSPKEKCSVSVLAITEGSGPWAVTH